MKTFFRVVILCLLSQKIFAIEYQKIDIKIPKYLTPLSIEKIELDCIGDKIEIQRNNLVNDLNFFNPGGIELEYYPDKFWEKAIIGKQLEVRSMDTYQDIGENSRFIFWNNSGNLARFDKKNYALLINTAHYQFQLMCKDKINNWN